MINITEIKKILPHNYPMLLVDKIEKICLDSLSIIGIKCVSFNEQFFIGHFEQDPIMPGVLIIESMAQTAAILAIKYYKKQETEKNNKQNSVYFMTIDNAKFRIPVRPGDVLKLHITTIKNKGKIWKFSGIAKVNDKIVSEANYMAMTN